MTVLDCRRTEIDKNFHADDLQSDLHGSFTKTYHIAKANNFELLLQVAKIPRHLD